MKSASLWLAQNSPLEEQVHSLCVDSQPGDRLRLAKGPLSLPPSSIILSMWSSRPAFGDGREKKKQWTSQSYQELLLRIFKKFSFIYILYRMGIH